MNQLKKFLKRLFTVDNTNFINQLNQLGFNKIAFPILIKEDADLNLFTMEDFASDADAYFHEFESNYELIDANGNLWDWKYDTTHKLNLPGNFIRTYNLVEVKEIVSQYFENTKIKSEIKELMENTNSISELFEKLKGKF